MVESFEDRMVRCPTCGDYFTIKRGLFLAALKGEERRVEPRFSALSIRIFLNDNLREFSVKDVSPTSLGVYHEGWTFTMSQTMTFDLIEGYAILFKSVRAKVVRIGEETVGCVIENLERKQMEKLCKLVAAKAHIAHATEDAFRDG